MEIKVTKLEIAGFLTANTGIHQDCQHCFVAPTSHSILLSMGHTKQHVHRLIWQSCRCCGFVRQITKYSTWVLANNTLFKKPDLPSSQVGTGAIDRRWSSAVIHLPMVLPCTEITFKQGLWLKRTAVGCFPPSFKPCKIGSSCTDG
jgi:hypothetical protein